MVGGWSSLDSGIKLIVRDRTFPGPWEFDAEANILLNKDASFWLSLSTSNLPNSPLLSLPLLLINYEALCEIYSSSEEAHSNLRFFFSFKNTKSIVRTLHVNGMNVFFATNVENIPRHLVCMNVYT